MYVTHGGDPHGSAGLGHGRQFTFPLAALR
jgi:hypothetical protein